ncbi:hybrid sensor histidine kinase/response regulator [Sphingomonas faeni]|uniref:hybrid sensor histidine kinase/response regulator n=1 Tax=Sphingomonas faeni TaxID=185950 RepID=UPI003345B8B6
MSGHFLAGSGEMASLLRLRDWSSHELGKPANWPEPLKSALRLILTTRHPAYLLWGSSGFCFYNDAYRASVGPEFHPRSFGLDARAVWREKWDNIGDQFDQVMRGGGATWNENELLPSLRNGKLEDVYWTSSYSSIYDAEAPNGIGGVLVICSETTEQIVVQRQLRLERERQRLMLQQIPGFAALLWGPEHRFEYVNAAYIALSGEREFIGRTVRTALPDLSGQGVFEALDQVYATGEPLVAVAMPLRFDRADGERFVDCVYEPVRDDAGKVIGIFVGGYDVTQQIRATEQLRDSECRFRLATEYAEIGFWDEDLVNDVLTWSSQTKAMFGIGPEWVGSMTDFYGGLHPDDLAATIAAYEAASDPKQRALYDVEYRTIGRADGQIRWVAAKGRGVFDETGRCIRRVETAIDITPRKAAEAKLRDMTETLETRVAERTAELEAAHEQLRQSQKLEAMGSLTGGVAHDFNNLLTPIVGALDMLQRKGFGSERDQRLVSGAAQSAERARLLVQRLLAFARKQPLQPVAVDLATLVRNMAELVSSTIGPKIKVAVDVDEDLPPAKADPNQLEMALLNLAVNARDAMPNGGSLTISAKLRPGEGAGLDAGDYLRLAVADSGVGMDHATLARAIEPFFSTKGVGSGTGLGLSMAHGLASQLGGALTIESEPGSGTSVALWLPRSATMLDADPLVGSTEMVRGHGTALVVDDEEFVRLSTAAMLTDLGFDVVEAASAEEALTIVENDGEVRLVVTDHLMPGMTGVDLAVRLNDIRAELPILIVSGYAEMSDGAPAVPRLAKPFRKDELVATLANLPLRWKF